jgi:hypothetical protein
LYTEGVVLKKNGKRNITRADPAISRETQRLLAGERAEARPQSCTRVVSCAVTHISDSRLRTLCSQSHARTLDLHTAAAASYHLSAPVAGEPRVHPPILSRMASAAARGAAARSPLLVHHHHHRRRGLPLVRTTPESTRSRPHISPFYKGSPLRSRLSKSRNRAGARLPSIRLCCNA